MLKLRVCNELFNHFRDYFYPNCGERTTSHRTMCRVGKIANASLDFLDYPTTEKQIIIRLYPSSGLNKKPFLDHLATVER